MCSHCAGRRRSAGRWSASGVAVRVPVGSSSTASSRWSSSCARSPTSSPPKTRSATATRESPSRRYLTVFHAFSLTSSSCSLRSVARYAYARTEEHYHYLLRTVLYLLVRVFVVPRDGVRLGARLRLRRSGVVISSQSPTARSYGRLINCNSAFSSFFLIFQFDIWKF